MGTNSQSRFWRHRSGALPLGERTLLMGIVNVTPDSFSDGGQFFGVDEAVAHATKLEADGADVLDFGAESTRPGSEAVSAGEQIRRLVPVLERLRGRLRVPVSVDTSLAEVAAACVDVGASIINDVRALREDAELASLCSRSGVGVVLMHMRGAPRTMQSDTHYDDLIGEVHAFLGERVRFAQEAGIESNRIVVDPGIGFGKSFDQNYHLLGALRALRGLGAGVLAGPSRKAFTGEFNKLPAARRQFSTAAATALAVLNGADVVRVHDVAEMRQVTDILDRFRQLHGQRDE